MGRIVVLAIIFFTLGLLTRNSLSRVLGLSEPNTGKEITLILGGDVMLGRTVMTKSLDGNDSTYPFRKVKDTTKLADLVFVNLETPIVNNCPRHYDGFRFCADPRMTQSLVDAGINVVNLANNHTLNYGEKGFGETVGFLTKNGISYVGEGNLVVKEVRGTKFGFLGFGYVPVKDSQKDLEIVRDSNSKVDVLIVGVHWGEEYQANPNRFQEELARKFISNGADVVVGHHPHWVQSIEYIDGKPIYYSLGNFVFDQMWSEKTKEGMLIRLTFRKDELVSEEKLPVYMKNWAQPEFVN